MFTHLPAPSSCPVYERESAYVPHPYTSAAAYPISCFKMFGEISSCLRLNLPKILFEPENAGESHSSSALSRFAGLFNTGNPGRQRHREFTSPRGPMVIHRRALARRDNAKSSSRKKSHIDLAIVLRLRSSIGPASEFSHLLYRR